MSETVLKTPIEECLTRLVEMEEPLRAILVFLENLSQEAELDQTGQGQAQIELLSKTTEAIVEAASHQNSATLSDVLAHDLLPSLNAVKIMARTLQVES